MLKEVGGGEHEIRVTDSRRLQGPSCVDFMWMEGEYIVGCYVKGENGKIVGDEGKLNANDTGNHEVRCLEMKGNSMRTTQETMRGNG